MLCGAPRVPLGCPSSLGYSGLALCKVLCKLAPRHSSATQDLSSNTLRARELPLSDAAFRSRGVGICRRVLLISTHYYMYLRGHSLFYSILLTANCCLSRTLILPRNIHTNKHAPQPFSTAAFFLSSLFIFFLNHPKIHHFFYLFIGCDQSIFWPFNSFFLSLLTLQLGNLFVTFWSTACIPVEVFNKRCPSPLSSLVTRTRHSSLLTKVLPARVGSPSTPFGLCLFLLHR